VRRSDHDALPQESLDIFATPAGHLAAEWRALQEVSEAVMVVERRNVRKAKGRFKVCACVTCAFYVQACAYTVYLVYVALHYVLVFVSVHLIQW
jgi:hypothetical protein